MMKLTREEEIKLLTAKLKQNARCFIEAHYPELKEYFAIALGECQSGLVRLGYTWEQVEEMEIETYNTAA